MNIKNLSVITVISILMLSAPRTEAKRSRTPGHKLDAELLTEEHKSIRIALDSVCVDWVCPTYLEKRVRVFYGSQYADSTIFVITTRSGLRSLTRDTITMSGPLNMTENAGVYPIVIREYDNYPLFAYSSASPFEYIIQENAADRIEDNSELQTYFNSGNKVIKIISDGRNSLKAFYLDQRFDKGVIMCISSKDNGKSWGYPEKSLSSNTENFVHATMAQTRKGDIYALLVNENGKAFISVSENTGHTWTYPKELSGKMDGWGHSMTIHRSGAFIVYRHETAESGTKLQNGDYILWTSSVNELESGAEQGIYKRILKKEIAEKNNVRNVNIIHLVNNRYLMTVIFQRDGKCVAECYKFGGNFYL